MKFHAGNRSITQQADLVLSQANPVSDTVYPVLPETSNVEILQAELSITWAVTQPTNLRLIVTVDGIVNQFIGANPVSGTVYVPTALESLARNASGLTDVNGNVQRILIALRLCCGKTVRVDAAITWAITQPTPLDCRIKWGRLA